MPTFNLADAFVTLGTRGSVAVELQKAKDQAGNLNKELARTSQAMFVDLARQQQQTTLAQTRLNIAQALAQAAVTGSAVQTRALSAQLVLQEKMAVLHAKQEGVISGLIGKDEHRRAQAAMFAADSEKALNVLRQQVVALQEQDKFRRSSAGQTAQGAASVLRARTDAMSANARAADANAAGSFATSGPARAAAAATVGADMATLLTQRKQELVLLQERAKFLASSDGTKAIREQISLFKQAEASQKQINYQERIAEVGRFRAATELAAGQMQKLGSSLKLAGAAAGVLGGVSFAGMMKFAEAASPGHALLFNQAMRDLSATIGRIFIPVMERATALIRGVADWFASLSPAAKQLFAALAVGAAAGAAAFAALTAAVGVATAAMLAFDAATGGILLVVGGVVTGAAALAGALAATASGAETAGKAGKMLGDIFNSISAAAGAIYKSLGIGDFFSGMFAGVLEMIQPIAAAFKELAVSIMSAFGGDGAAKAFEFGKMIGKVFFMISGIGPLVTMFATAVISGLSMIINVAEKVVAVFGVVGKAISNAMSFNPKKIAEAMAKVPGEIQKAFAEIDKKHADARKQLEEKKDSTGAGGGAPLITSIAEAGERFREKAMAMFAGGAKKEPAERAAAAAERQEVLLERVLAELQRGAIGGMRP